MAATSSAGRVRNAMPAQAGQHPQPGLRETRPFFKRSQTAASSQQAAGTSLIG